MQTEPQVKVLFICRKKTGNFIVSRHHFEPWKLISPVISPEQLYFEITKFHKTDKVIISEYRFSQLIKLGSQFTEKDALRLFGVKQTKANIEDLKEKIKNYPCF